MRILIIDDELNICLTLQSILEDEGYNCEYATEAAEGLKKYKEFIPEIVLLDVRLEDSDGLELLDKIFEIDKRAKVIMISGHSGIKEAVEAIKKGAYDFLEKPLSLTKVKLAVMKAQEFNSISRHYQELKSNINEHYKIIGNSQEIQRLRKTIAKVAKSDSKVLIRGESGTGKELVAYAIHHNSKRDKNPFIKFNCAAIPKDLVESELFGYEKGSFTGAEKAKPGKIEQADGGTLFLDEIGDMNLSAQAKILRVIQEGEFERVGSNKTIKVDTRIIAATNKDLEEMVKNNEFREDLFYRLNVIPIKTPPLREHPEDITILIEHFSNFFAKELKIPRKEFSKDAVNAIFALQFKGNVRELSNLIERIYILCENRVVTGSAIENLLGKPTSKLEDFWNEPKNFKDKKRDFEIRYLKTQLKLNDGNLSKTAENLGLHISNLSRKLKELEIK
ncbi:MAG: sigma-54 dependent transcriptional regulator [Candidatus Cloacimonadota bacterium]|nr:sigma-54 dependent transcriptional regulator [Candidatus Cloacimonadota bacterium]